MIRREQPKSSNSLKVTVGEIDTSAPFQSVKDAVNLFGEGALSGEKPSIKQVKPRSAERVFARETKLNLAEKDLNKLKQQLKNAENTKAEALAELENAKQTAKELSQRIETISESKDVALKATKSSKFQAKQIEEANSGSIAVTTVSQQQGLECATKQYMNALEELNAAKQELTKIRQDYDAALAVKTFANKKMEEAELAANSNSDRAQEISKQISDAVEMTEQVNQATNEANQDLTMMFAEKDAQRQTYEADLAELAKKLKSVKREFDPELAKNLEAQLAETMSEIHTLQREMEAAKSSDMETLRTVTSDLGGAKGSLQKVLEEESALQQLVQSLGWELENLKKEHADLRKKEAETESAAGNLHVKLRKSKSELESYITRETRARVFSGEMIATRDQLSSETNLSRAEAQELKTKAEELEKEAQAMRASVEEAEKLLKITLEEAAQAKAAEESALEQIKVLSERTNSARSSVSESGAKITLSRDEFESLSRKAEESGKLAELKVAAALAQVEAVKASESEALRMLESAQKETEDAKIATHEALKRADMAEAAKQAVEGELRRWRDREQKRAAEAASKIQAETHTAQACTEGRVNIETIHHATTTAKFSPIHNKFQKQKSEVSLPTIKLERRRTSLPKYGAIPHLGGIFHRKKSQVETGTPSYLPGETPL